MNKTIIWLEDNPALVTEYRKLFVDNEFNIVIWDGAFDALSGESGGEKCLRHFSAAVEANRKNSSDVIAFILDVRIPVPSLETLADLAEGTDSKRYFKRIITKGGLLTGILVADYYLRNKIGNSPIGDLFKDKPILLLSVAGQLDKEYPDLPKDFRVIEKTSPTCCDEILAWIDIIKFT